MKYKQDFLDVKELEGCSEKTIKYYDFCLDKIDITKEENEITTQDIRNFLMRYKRARNVSTVTLDNMRRVYNSYFAWLNNEGIISSNPCAAVSRIKSDKIIKKPFNDEELEILREAANNDLRLRAIIELLYSSGVRVSELVAINKNDIDWENQSIVVFGKGHKEREVYFNVKAKLLLKKYIESRDDNNEALFVNVRRPHGRLSKDRCEAILRKLGEECDIHCHPHRFRRTCATTLANKGMPIQEVSKVLGHAKIETTLLYCTVDQENVKMNHKKYI